MKNNDPSEAMLDNAFKQWKIEETLPPRFNKRVWSRIAREESQPSETLWTRFSAWLTRAIAQPAVATAYVAVLLLGGVAAGAWHARVDNARTSQELGTRYVKMMDPYRMPPH